MLVRHCDGCGEEGDGPNAAVKVRDCQDCEGHYCKSCWSDNHTIHDLSFHPCSASRGPWPEQEERSGGSDA